MTDDLVWGNHYLLKGFDEASVAEVLKVGVVTKDGQALASAQNDRGVFVTVGSTNILDKDKAYRMKNQMNRLLDGHQNLSVNFRWPANTDLARRQKYSPSAKPFNRLFHTPFSSL